MHDLLTQPRAIELSKLHDHLITWKFASERLTKYGFRPPEPTVLFDALRMSCERLAEKDSEFKFHLQSFISKHSSVNGLVDDVTVKSLYDMILDHARAYLTVKADAVKAMQDKPGKDGCFICGSKDHWCNDCPEADDRRLGNRFPQAKGGGKQGQPAKGKARLHPKGQGRGQLPPKPQGDAQRARGKGAKKGKGKGR